ncbi:SpoIIE family protein phosphatase [Streptomyces sp. NPDC020125]|uniref:SpoIIE family protein phosphatase n=1 Tax=Streptomyces sp. NPDC020125 TaxID=3154593 RepID=UPI00340942D1
MVEPLRAGGLADSVYERADREPDRAQLARRDATDRGRWTPVTAGTFRDEVLALAKGLLAEGVRFGDRVALMARTRYEWTLFSYALWSVGAQVVTVYPTSSAEQVRWILAQTRAVAVVVEGEDHAMTVGAVCDALPWLRSIWQMDQGCVAELGRRGADVHEELVTERRWLVEPRCTAVICYTSGTTGQPLGCLITHANLAAECDTLFAGWNGLFAEPGVQPAILAFLPLAHIYGLMVQVLCVRGGILMGHEPELTPSVLLPSFQASAPPVSSRCPTSSRRSSEPPGPPPRTRAGAWSSRRPWPRRRATPRPSSSGPRGKGKGRVRGLAAEPGAEIGGDLYAAARTSNTTRLIIGDVRGSGLTAVADASLVLGAFRAMAHWPVPLTDLAAHLDTALSAERTEPPDKAPGAGESFVTAAVLEIPDDQPVVRLVNCGHPPPIMLSDSGVKALEGHAPALPLGLGHLVADRYHSELFPFEEGDQLLLYTDGVIEARNSEGTFYPLVERLPGWNGSGPQHLVDRLHRDLLSHTGGHQGDDAALVVLERHGAEP